MEDEEAQVAVMVEETYERLDKVERYFFGVDICNRICRHETYECLNEVDRYLFPMFFIIFVFVFEHEFHYRACELFSKMFYKARELAEEKKFNMDGQSRL